MTIYEQQELLDLLGYNPDKDQPARIRRTFVDGIDGPNTQAALDAFRADYGVGAEGLIGALAGTVPKVEGKDIDDPTFDQLVETTMPSYSESPNNLDAWSTIKHFKREEFRCKCGGQYCNGFPAEMDMDLIRIADGIREHFGVEARVSSGLRCEKWNVLKGGKPASRHKIGKAMDFCVVGVSGARLDAYIGSLHGIRYHYHISDGYCHMDVP